MKNLYACLPLAAVLGSLFVTSQPLLAQGTAFTYQGRLNNNSGPANGSYDLKFTLYDANQPVNNFIAGPMTNAATAVSNGLFTVTLDFGNVFNGSARWLEIAVETNGGSGFATLNPRQQLTPTPYAVFATTAGNLSGTVSASQLTGTPGAAVNFTGALNGDVTGSQSATVVASVGGQSAAGVAGGVSAANAATSANTANTIVKRGPSGNFSAGTITAAAYSGTNGGVQFITGGAGMTMDGLPVITSGGGSGLTIQQNSSGAPNVIEGSSMNSVSNGVVGATIGGGGATNYNHYGYILQASNYVAADFGTVSGGADNSAGQTSFVGGGAYNNATGIGAVVGGGSTNTASGYCATVSGGFYNTASGSNSVVGGGGGFFYIYNNLNGYYTNGNIASGDNSVVAGGSNNNATNTYAVVSGGLDNTASYEAAVGGGFLNAATGQGATVPGGNSNIASGNYSFAAGDQAQATNQGAFVWADSQGTPFASTNNDSFNVRAQGGVSFATGFAGVNFATGGAGVKVDGKSVLLNGGGIVANATSFVAGLNSATSTGPYSSVCGGNGNAASGIGAFVGGGGILFDFQTDNFIYSGNTAGGYCSAVVGGCGNNATGIGAFIGGGGSDGTVAQGNIANGYVSVLNGGIGNNIGPGGYAATIGGGENNINNGNTGTIAGGYGNLVTNSYATVPGGSNNVAGGVFSFAAGQQAQALHQGAFVWADSQSGAFSSTTNDEFSIRANGGVRIQSDKGIHLNANDRPIIVRDWDVFATNAPSYKAGIGRWGLFMEPTVLTIGIPSTDVSGRSFQVAKYSTNGTPTTLMKVDQSGNLTTLGTVTANGVQLTSDRNAKENFSQLDFRGVLDKVVSLPVMEWNYKVDSSGQKHIGPMAQDFHKAFGLNGVDDKHISVVDESGVALAAIQGLNQKLEKQAREKDAEIKELRQNVEELKLLVQQLAARK